MSGFVVQVSGMLPPHALDRGDGVRRHTVLRATVRDQAALYGLFTMLNDLGLELLSLRVLPSPQGDGEAFFPEHGAPMTIEVIVRGSIGELALSVLGDHVEVTHLATRLVLSDHQMMGQVLDWARDADAAVEYAAEDLQHDPAARLTGGPPAAGDAPTDVAAPSWLPQESREAARLRGHTGSDMGPPREPTDREEPS